MKTSALLFALCLASAACSREKSVAASDSRKPAPPPLDACSLLTADEITAIQGAAPTATAPSQSDQGGMMVTQCLFTLPTAANSIALTLSQRAEGGGGRDAREVWNEMFHTDRRERKEEEEHGEEKEKRGRTPDKIENLGDEAFMTSLRFGAVLYVLKGDRFLRVSIGGPHPGNEQLEKPKALATAALKRL